MAQVQGRVNLQFFINGSPISCDTNDGSRRRRMRKKEKKNEDEIRSFMHKNVRHAVNCSRRLRSKDQGTVSCRNPHKCCAWLDFSMGRFQGFGCRSPLPSIVAIGRSKTRSRGNQSIGNYRNLATDGLWAYGFFRIVISFISFCGPTRSLRPSFDHLAGLIRQRLSFFYQQTFVCVLSLTIHKVHTL